MLPDYFLKRRSIRAYLPNSVSTQEKEDILSALMRAPTAGNMMLYTVIEVDEQSIKDQLATSCDNQPFIAQAPLVLLFLADYQRWLDYFRFSDVPSVCSQRGMEMRSPQEGDLMLACCDAIIAAQTAVLAAESLGIGSCYIGDIMENYEFHRDLFHLPQYVFPITMVCFGRARTSNEAVRLPPRFPKQNIIHTNRYIPLTEEMVADFERPLVERYHPNGKFPQDFKNMAQATFFRKFASDFSLELNRSVREILKNWQLS